VADALTIPHAVAALVLIVAGVTKLGSPRAAARAVGMRPAAIRLFATFEIALGGWALLAGGPASAGLMAAVYAGFAALTLVLARAGAACGCFGEERAPASPVQSLLSGTLGLVCVAATHAGTHPLAWVLGRPVGTAAVLVLGTAGAVYGTVLAYSELPLVWRSWSPA
jgi:hypothetical protein